MKKIIKIQNAVYIEGFKIELKFDDGTTKTIDFTEFLDSATNPLTKKFHNPEEFKKFKLEYGDLVWGDYELCFPVWDLYTGNICKENHVSA